jgi:uncharacterized protein (DUF4415 family)
MDSEWDEAKRQANILKHGIDFVDAIEIFAGEFIETEDLRRDYGEHRLVATGEVSGAASSARGGRDEMSEERITRVTLAQARKMKSQTDWTRVAAMTDEDIDRAIADNPDAAPIWTEEEWTRRRVVWPQGKAPVTLRLDKDIIAWFKLRGRGYQTRINAVLRAFVEAQKPRR